MEQNSIFDGNITPELKHELAGAASWGRIAAMIGLAGAIISFITSVAAGNLFGSIVSTVISVVLNVFLLRFGNNTGNSIRSNDQGLLIEGVEALRTYFKVSAIIILIVFILVAVVFLGAFAVGMIGAR